MSINLIIYYIKNFKNLACFKAECFNCNNN